MGKVLYMMPRRGRLTLELKDFEFIWAEVEARTAGWRLDYQYRKDSGIIWQAVVSEALENITAMPASMFMAAFDDSLVTLGGVDTLIGSDLDMLRQWVMEDEARQIRLLDLVIINASDTFEDRCANSALWMEEWGGPDSA